MSSAGPAPEAPLRCPRCQAEVPPDQDWCLECGYAARTRVASPPGWRGPVIVVAVLALLAGAAVALALVAVSDSGTDVTPTVSTNAGTNQQSTTTPATTPSTQPASSPSTTPTLNDPTLAGNTSWPQGKSGWTVLILQTSDGPAAAKRAKQLKAEKVQVGVVRTDDFKNLKAGSFLVFSGRYPSKSQVDAAVSQSQQTGLSTAKAQYLQAG